MVNKDINLALERDLYQKKGIGVREKKKINWSAHKEKVGHAVKKVKHYFVPPAQYKELNATHDSFTVVEQVDHGLQKHVKSFVKLIKAIFSTIWESIRSFFKKLNPFSRIIEERKKKEEKLSFKFNKGSDEYYAHLENRHKKS